MLGHRASVNQRRLSESRGWTYARHVSPTDSSSTVPGSDDSATDVLFVLGSLGPGGQERQLYYLCRELSRRELRPVVAVWNYREDEVYVDRLRQDSVEVLDLGRGLVSRLNRLRRLVRERKPRIVQAHAFYCNLFVRWATLGTGIPAIGVIRGHFPRVKAVTGPLLGRLCARWPRTQICNSHLSTALARGGGFWAPLNVETVENGIDFERFPQAAAPLDDQPLIFGVGSLLPVKRWDLLIDAAERLHESGREFRLTIAGEGPERNRLEERIRSAGLSRVVRLPGFTAQVGPLLAEAVALALTSDHEGLPNVVVEAMAVGRPVVATRAGDTPRLIRDGETGYLIDRGDAGGVYRALAELLDNRQRRQQMGDKAREEALRRFSIERLGRETLSVYRLAGAVVVP